MNNASHFIRIIFPYVVHRFIQIIVRLSDCHILIGSDIIDFSVSCCFFHFSFYLFCIDIRNSANAILDQRRVVLSRTKEWRCGSCFSLLLDLAIKAHIFITLSRLVGVSFILCQFLLSWNNFTFHFIFKDQFFERRTIFNILFVKLYFWRNFNIRLFINFTVFIYFLL